MHAVILVC
jgi:hypothetical protein